MDCLQTTDCERRCHERGRKKSSSKVENWISHIRSTPRRDRLRRLRNSHKYPHHLKDVALARKVETDGDLSVRNSPEETLEVGDADDVEVDYVGRIERDILSFNCYSQLTLGHIAGLDSIKEMVKEAMILPAMRPDLFKGLRSPVKGVLLFGPPGTGKTLLGKCIASEMRSTLFNVSSTTLTSKWMGDAEKLVRTLFVVAKCRQPSVIFIDEIDAILSQRSAQDSGSTRRMKNEFLVQMDGCNTNENDKVVVLGTTNRPQELDDAARRRFVLKLYIPLPDAKDRKELLKKLLDREAHCLVENDFKDLARRTAGFSGADLSVLCREAAMGPIRDIPKDRLLCIASSKIRPMTRKDFQKALVCTKASVSKKDVKALSDWNKQYGWECLPKKECQ